MLDTYNDLVYTNLTVEDPTDRRLIMYVIQYLPDYSTPMLHELDKKGLRLAKLAYPNHKFVVVSGLAAHRWVREGFNHSTPLYIDQYNGGRIRYARDAS